MKFQRARGLRVTGKVDQATATALGLQPLPTPAPAPPVDVTLQSRPLAKGPCWYGDTWQAARGSGRVHLGVDIGAPTGNSPAGGRHGPDLPGLPRPSRFAVGQRPQDPARPTVRTSSTPTWPASLRASTSVCRWPPARRSARSAAPATRRSLTSTSRCTHVVARRSTRSPTSGRSAPADAAAACASLAAPTTPPGELVAAREQRRRSNHPGISQAKGPTGEATLESSLGQAQTRRRGKSGAVLGAQDRRSAEALRCRRQRGANIPHAPPESPR